MRAFTVDDLYLHQKITSLHCIAERDESVATVRSVDRASDGYGSHLWTFALDGRPPRQPTRGSASDTAPSWSPVGKRIAFVSDRGGRTPQLRLIDVDGGEARPCGQVDGGVSSLRWAPHGASVYVAGIVNVDPDARGRRAPPPDAWRPEVAWKLPYKADGTGYTLAREVRLFRIDADTGESVQLTDGPFDVRAFDPSSDGRHVAFARTRAGRFAHCSDLWVCDTDGSNARQLTRELARVAQPVWSPDGRRIAFAGAEQAGDGQSSLYVLDFHDGDLRRLGDDGLEVAQLIDALHWSVDGSRLLFVRAHRGCHEVASIAADGTGLATLLAGERQPGAFGRTREQLVHSAEHPTAPSELYASSRDGSEVRKLSDLNAWWSERTPLQAERRQFDVPDGCGGRETIDGWLIWAAEAKPMQPLLADVHGGPGSHALLDFDTNVFWQVLCLRKILWRLRERVGAGAQRHVQGRGRDGAGREHRDALRHVRRRLLRHRPPLSIASARASSRRCRTSRRRGRRRCSCRARTTSAARSASRRRCS